MVSDRARSFGKAIKRENKHTHGDSSMVKLLLEYGADPEHEDEDGERPILWAAANGYQPITGGLIRIRQIDEVAQL
ncbi:unnamed protein product [Penicillium palitans]